MVVAVSPAQQFVVNELVGRFGCFMLKLSTQPLKCASRQPMIGFSDFDENVLAPFVSLLDPYLEFHIWHITSTFSFVVFKSLSVCR